jgi:predicted AlkP superfamily phosphohydrolase/phosphomutase
MYNKKIDRRDFLKLALGSASAAALHSLPFPVAYAGSTHYPKSVVVLGIDGMDPWMLEKMITRDLMSNFQKLIKQGSYSPLGTSIPPQSPVAWSNFITGQDPGTHGIFDIIHRDPETYFPQFAMSATDDPSRVLNIGDWSSPMYGGGVRLLRRGKAFWETLGEHGIPCTVFKMPSNYPPVECDANSLSGMGTPDVLGTYGTFSYYTNDPDYMSLDVSGGEVFPVTIEHDKIEAMLNGPENTMKKSKPVMQMLFSMYVDKANRMIKFITDDDELLLKEGEWSRWVRVNFPVKGPFHSLKGIVRLYIKSVEPYFNMYVSPINIDPSSPALPISVPADYAKDLYKKVGYFYTQGMAEETKGLESGVLDDDEFMQQARIVLDERRKLLDAVIDDYHGGFLFYYVSSLDLCQHMMWRNHDPNHPGHTEEAAKHKGTIVKLYNEMDKLVGHVMERIPKDSTLIVMSDHGFSPFYKKFNLNTWLAQNDFMNLRRQDNIDQYEVFGNVNWRKTKAYGVGINGLYVNMRGREGRGIVRAGADYDDLTKELTAKLLAERDPETGEQVVSHVYPSREHYHGRNLEHAPDIIVGYNVGYRNSDESALGNFNQQVLRPNMSKWSGDHCMAPEHIPGIVAANKQLAVDDPTLSDFAATILDLFELDDEPPPKSRKIFKS